MLKRTLLTAAVVALLGASAPLFADVTPEAKALIKAQMQKAPAVTSAELKKMLAEEPDLVILDVRQDSEIPKMGRIVEKDRQIEIPRGYTEIKAYGAIPDRDAKIVAYCGKGIRSAFVANTLRDMGYKNAMHLKGGAKAWKAAGNETH